MPILVTGGAGYIGSHTVLELLKADYQVVVVDNFSNSSPKVIERMKEISGKDFYFIEMDISDIQHLDQIFKRHQIDCVVHFAAYKAVGESVELPLKYYDNNISNSISLIEVMNQNNVYKMVYSSSATVYGINNPSPLEESMPIGTATNPYGFSKIVIEQLLKDVCFANNQWGSILLRYFNPIGAHESGNLGEDPQGVPNNIMPYITQVAIGKREILSIFGNDYDTPDGTGVRDYIHVLDLAKGHVKAVDKLLRETGISIYNLGTGQGYSVLDLVTAFEESTGQSIPYKIVARRPGDVASVYANPTLAKKELNWQAEKNLNEMCKDSWRWQTNNPQGYDE